MLLLKYDRDVEKAVEALPKIMGEEENHHHDHDHDHSHGHVHNKHRANYFGATGGKR
jgi:ABC-type Zn2+ transport system substrate-binding protein/surface adhesin